LVVFHEGATPSWNGFTSDAGIIARAPLNVLIMFLFVADGLAHRSRDVFIQGPGIYEKTDFQEGIAEEPLSSVWPRREAAG